MVGPLFKVSVVPGDGVVAREGAAVLVAHPAGSAHESFVDQLLATLAEAARHTDVPAVDIIRAVAASVVLAAPEDVPAFGLVTRHGNDLAVILSGDVRLQFSQNGEDAVLSGIDATTFVERVIREPFGDLLLTYAADVAPDPRSNLTGGVVRGAGLALSAGDTMAAVEPTEPTMVDLTAPSPAPSLPEVQAAEVVVPEMLSEGEITTDESPDTAPVPNDEDEVPTGFTVIPLFGEETPAAVDEAPATVTPDAHTGVVPIEVQGIMCSRGHFNSPAARFCVQCGISMVHQTHHLVTRARPPLGVLVSDEGAVHPLSADVVIGRDPETAEDVVSGHAVPLLMQDPGGSMSRIHARIVLVGWDVNVVDASSANGTFVATTDEDEWTRLEPGVPTTVKPGSRISMGGRTLTFESHQKR